MNDCPKYSRDLCATKHIYVISADGTGSSVLVEGQYPSWSPDGRRIAFNKGGIFTVKSDGTGLTRLTAISSFPVWSPEGNRIGFVRWNNELMNVYVINVDGTGEVNLSTTDFHEWSPVWSPDGRRLAVTTESPGTMDDTGVIVVINADGSGRMPLGDRVDPAWSPDGTRIVYLRYEGPDYCPDLNRNNLHVIDAAGGVPTKITDTQDYLGSPSWSSK